MHLTVIASQSGRAPQREDSWVLRLVGTPQSDETPPPNILSIIDQSAAEVRATFPEWLWRWVSNHRALELKVFSGSVSWWWYTPISEKSPLRSRLIRELYWLTLLRRVIETYTITEVKWIGDDPLFTSVVASLAAQRKVKLHFESSGGSKSSSFTRSLTRRVIYSVFAIVRWLILKILFVGKGTGDADFDVALYSRFPILWERQEPLWRERMFGFWPDYLRTRGHRTGYIALFSGSLKTLIREWRTLRAQCRQQNIWIIERAVSFFSLLRAHFSLGLFWNYFRWRRRLVRQPVLYNDLNVNALLWRELDAGLLSSEIPLDLTIASGISSIVRKVSSLRMMFLPFEYQPMERAVWAGAKSLPEISIVGLQTGLFASNQMGFSFPVEEIKRGSKDDLKSPVPDVLAAYGALPYRIFAERLGSERVCLSGPIRYSSLQTCDPDAGGSFSIEDAPQSAVFVLVATSIAREESVPLLETAFRASAELPEIFFLIKFHYHLPLHTEVKNLAARYGMDRYRVFDSDLYELMRVAPIVICAGSSIGLEAMTLGCMPIVFRSLGEMSANPMLDVPDAVFFWHSIVELRAALQSCLVRDAEYQKRKSAWPRAIADQLDLAGSPDERLYEFLRKQAIV
jgi:surface carbohydrate biosynthesis protein (TIGR04326 family)